MNRIHVVITNMQYEPEKCDNTQGSIPEVSLYMVTMETVSRYMVTMVTNRHGSQVIQIYMRSMWDMSLVYGDIFVNYRYR